MFKFLSGWMYWLFGLENKKGKVLLLGLDNAGKTTLLHYLKTGKLRQSVPTYQQSTEDIQIGGVTLSMYDLGGQKARRKLWKTMLHIKPAAIIFMVDSSSLHRLEEASIELNNLLNDPTIEDIPVLILGNKVDKENALSEADMVKQLNIYDFQHGHSKRNIKLFMCSLLLRAGVKESLQWLVNII